MDDEDYEEALRAAHEAENGLRKLYGRKPKPYSKGKPPYCSFCGSGKNQVDIMIEGADVHICDECVDLCSKIIIAEKKNKH